VKLRCPTTYTCVKRSVPQPQVFSHLNVSRLAVAPDTVLINVPKLKTHNLAITTLCLKNLMGLVNVFDRHYCGQAWRELAAAGMLPESEGRPREAWIGRRGWPGGSSTSPRLSGRCCALWRASWAAMARDSSAGATLRWAWW